jgi:hypothetical protein
VETLINAQKGKAITTAMPNGIIMTVTMTVTVITIVQTGIIKIATGTTQPDILMTTIETGFMTIMLSEGTRGAVLQVWPREATVVCRQDMQEGGQSAKGYRVT